MKADDLWNKLKKQLSENDPSLIKLDLNSDSHNEYSSLLSPGYDKKKVKHERMKNLCELLKYNTTITSLGLRNRQLGTADGKMLEYLCDALKVNNTITHLDLTSNQLYGCSNAALLLATMLESNKGLISLDLSGNSINNDFMKILSVALEKNTSIKELNLEECDLQGREILTTLIQLHQRKDNKLSILGIKKVLSRKAKQGHAKEQCQLGFCNEVGGLDEFPTVNMKEAIHWFKEAAKQKYPEAIQSLNQISVKYNQSQTNSDQSSKDETDESTNYHKRSSNTLNLSVSKKVKKKAENAQLTKNEEQIDESESRYRDNIENFINEGNYNEAFSKMHNRIKTFSK